MLYLTFFPKAAQGPITVYSHMHSALKERKVYFEMFMEGLKRFVAGLSKKVLILRLQYTFYLLSEPVRQLRYPAGCLHHRHHVP